MKKNRTVHIPKRPAIHTTALWLESEMGATGSEKPEGTDAIKSLLRRSTSQSKNGYCVEIGCSTEQNVRTYLIKV